MSHVKSGLSDLVPRMSSLATALNEQLVREDHDSLHKTDDDAGSTRATALLRKLVQGLQGAMSEIRRLDASTKLADEYLTILNGLIDALIAVGEIVSGWADSPSTTNEVRSAVSRLRHTIEELRWDVSIELAKILPLDPDARVLETAQQVRDWIATIDDRD